MIDSKQPIPTYQPSAVTVIEGTNTAPDFGVCPAQDKNTGKCYSKAFFEAKPGKAKECVRPCEFEDKIIDWNESHGTP